MGASKILTDLIFRVHHREMMGNMPPESVTWIPGVVTANFKGRSLENGRLKPVHKVVVTRFSDSFVGLKEDEE